MSLRHLHRWRAQWQLRRDKGRPSGVSAGVAVPSGCAGVCGTPGLSFVGVHLFARWLDQHKALEPVVRRLKEAISEYQRTHPAEDFALLPHHDSTLRRRFDALVLSPLLGIERLSAFDTPEHPRETLIGKSYQSTTRRQCLGQLERIEAGPWLLPILLPAQGGQFVDGDGHMLAYWSRKAMHKGQSTMRGRIMAGSQAVRSHDETGQAVYGAYSPPAMHLSQLIGAYGTQVALATGSARFVIDRAVNAKAMAQDFDAGGLGLLCMLDDPEPHGLERFEATQVKTLDDGTRLDEGPWKIAREADNRPVVIVEPKDHKTLVYWGSPQVKLELEAHEWPEVSRARTSLQENAFQRMMEPGALAIHVGRKTILGPDRHQQRAEAQGRGSLEAARPRGEQKRFALEAKREQVTQSAAQGHGKRLEQRQRAAAELADKRREAQQHEAH